MKITYDLEKKVRFDTLYVGDTFVDVRYDKELWVVVAPEIDILLEEDPAYKDVGEEYYGCAVNLHTGRVNGFYGNEEVIKVECEIRVSSI